VIQKLQLQLSQPNLISEPDPLLVTLVLTQVLSVQDHSLDTLVLTQVLSMVPPSEDPN
jgi:hypothetical protein